MRTGSGAATELSHKERAQKLNEIFVGQVVPLFKKINDQAVDVEADGQLYYWQALEYQNRNNKADLIKQKYEQITREYSSQNMQFQEKHLQIKTEETKKREEIMANFDAHIAQIKQSMDEDIKTH